MCSTTVKPAAPLGPPGVAAKQTMKPISNTAFYCCGIRMRDAESPRPVCGDQFAKLFMNEQGMEIFRRFAGEGGPNMSNVARARYIDDLLRARLASDPHLQVVLIGCGFDSRAFRLQGGSWFELDEPALIGYKNGRLPAAEAPNALQRIPIDFETEPLREKLRPLVSRAATLFVIEGVTMYLTAESLRATLGILSLFPQHQVIADLMTRRFIEKYGSNVKRIIAQLGAQMIPGDQPALPFEACGYRQISSQEIARLAFAYQSLGWLVPLVRALFPGLFTGYTVRVFEPGLLRAGQGLTKVGQQDSLYP
jgi:methyltransferase (TIGR00027 family)